MRITTALYVITVWFVTPAQTTVGDFAPLRIGNEWEYVYFDTIYSGVMAPVRSSYFEQSRVRIKITSSLPSEKGTRYIIAHNVEGTGRRVLEDGSDTIIESIARTGIDTVNDNGVSIEREFPFTCPVIPFYWAHDFDTGSHFFKWDKITLNGHEYIRIISAPDIFYIQNIGLESMWTISISSSMIQKIRTMLDSFNGNPMVHQKVKSNGFSRSVHHIPDNHTLMINLPRHNRLGGTLLNGVVISRSRKPAFQPVIVHESRARNP